MTVALDPSIVTRAETVFMGVATGDEARGPTYVDTRLSDAPPPTSPSFGMLTKPGSNMGVRDVRTPLAAARP